VDIKNPNERILRLKDVMARTGVSRSTLYAWMKMSTFPKAVALGGRSIGWRESDISSWIENRTHKKLT